MNFLNVFKHLLPNAEAWKITQNKKLRQLFEGLSGTADLARNFIDLVWLDLLPSTTRELEAWEKQFGLKDNGLGEDKRRDRLAATWKALGGQDPQYIEDTLQLNGFNVFVHQWWEPGSEPKVGDKACATPRNPLEVLQRASGVSSLVECGDTLAISGEEFAQAGNSTNPLGKLLVNKIESTATDLIPLCGEEFAEAGEPAMTCGNFVNFRSVEQQYSIPLDSKKWPYFLYIGAKTYPQPAQIESSRKEEFEALCLKICPAQQWLGLLVDYV